MKINGITVGVWDKVPVLSIPCHKKSTSSILEHIGLAANSKLGQETGEIR